MKCNNAVLVFLKQPIKGKVKTRIAQACGDAEAVRIYKALVREVLSKVWRTTEYDIHVCFAPKEKEAEIQEWIEALLTELEPNQNSRRAVEYHAQCEGGLGNRLEHAFQSTFLQGYKKVAAIGTDCPQIKVDTLLDAFNQCESYDFTFGPTEDGGYYLIAMKEFSSVPFRNIPWSSEQTLEATLDQAHTNALSSTLLPPLFDIDYHEDWLRLLALPEGECLR